MNTFIRFTSRAFALLFMLSASISLNAQCATWNDSPDKEKAENAHVSYRNFVKGTEDFTKLSEEEFNTSFKDWKIVYDIAPAADGQRPFHYIDGREFYRAMGKKATDAAKKKEYNDRLISFYDEELVCYPKNEAFLLGRKANDMFYLQGYSIESIETFEKAMKAGGENTEYIVLAPLGQQLNYYFKTKKIDNKRVRELYDMASKIADANIEKGGDYTQYWEAGKANLDFSVLEFADQIFDCAYFKETLMPKFEENEEDYEVVKYILSKLKDQGCPETDADVQRVQAKYDAIYATLKSEQEVKRREMNPLYDASILMDEGDFAGAIKRYEDAIENAESNEKKAQAYYQIASVQSGKLRQYGAARQNASKAAALNPNWGKPYIMIGDIYARLGSSCGDSYQQRLAVLAAIDKYNQAKRVDGEVTGDANRRIANYRGSMPIRSEAFQRGDNEGDRITVGCGIGEVVTLRF
jgi:tetratricopeptide (TPR) repeat protein